MIRGLQKLIVICGPTAVGKSGIAVRLAEKVGGEIISADSRQVYLGLDIGTGKITKREMHGVPHHLLSIVSPKRAFTVAEYKKLADRAIEKIIKKGKIPILVGGTGLYVQAIVDGLAFPEVPPDTTLRSALDKKNVDTLFHLLRKLDQKRAATIDKKNKRRIIRAIEIAQTLGSVPKMKKHRRYDTLFIGLTFPGNVLAKKIKQRLLTRLRAGMIAEATKLHTSGLSYKRMEELGLEYRYLARYLQGKLSKEEVVKHLGVAIRQYAKRQKTWFQRDKRIMWFSPNEFKRIKKTTIQFLHQKR